MRLPAANLPFCSFLSGSETHLGVGIGTWILDLFLLSDQGFLKDVGEATQLACRKSKLNDLMICGSSAWASLRESLTRLLRADAAEATQSSLTEMMVPVTDITFTLPVAIGNYTDFYASLDHATNVGRLFRPDQPLLPNYKYLPIAYHGRASSLVLSGTSLRRPHGQMRLAAEAPPVYSPTLQLDYEVEVGRTLGATMHSEVPSN